jgi:hypothetical protein
VVGYPALFVRNQILFMAEVDVVGLAVHFVDLGDRKAWDFTVFRQQ